MIPYIVRRALILIIEDLARAHHAKDPGHLSELERISNELEESERRVVFRDGAPHCPTCRAWWPDFPASNDAVERLTEQTVRQEAPDPSKPIT